jgi:hypothetical protein
MKLHDPSPIDQYADNQYAGQIKLFGRKP